MKTFVFYTGLTLAFLFTACSDDNDRIYEPPVSFSDKPIVLSYDTYIEDTDVQILNNDTTQISVSRNYLNAIGADFEARNADTIPVAIWRTIDTAPFVRNVVAFQEQGDRLILTSVPGDIADVLPNCDVNLDSKIYVDFSQNSRTTYAYTSGDNYSRYIDSEGVIHPTVIILEKGETQDDTTESRGEAGNVYYTAEELAKSNASFDIINENKELGLHRLEFTNGTIYIRNTYLKAKTGLKVTLQTEMFKLEKFECGIYGDLALNMTAGFEAGEKITMEGEKDIVSFNSYTSVYWVDSVPVAITCDAGMKLKGEATLSEEYWLRADIDFSASYNAGVEYSGNWSNYNTADCDASATNLSVVERFFKGYATVETGAHLFVDVSLYGYAGAYLTVGATVLTDCAMGFIGGTTDVVEKTTGSIQVGGELSAELKEEKWQIAPWSVDYTVWEADLWDETYDVDE